MGVAGIIVGHPHRALRHLVGVAAKQGLAEHVILACAATATVPFGPSVVRAIA